MVRFQLKRYVDTAPVVGTGSETDNTKVLDTCGSVEELATKGFIQLIKALIWIPKALSKQKNWVGNWQPNNKPSTCYESTRGRAMVFVASSWRTSEMLVGSDICGPLPRAFLLCLS